MALKIYDTFAPQGNYPAVKAEDVGMPDGTRLSEFSGSAGQAGLTPYIGANGNWWIGDTDTGTKAQGEKGDKGDQGIQGEKGAKGDTGATGAKGDTGAAGAKGDKGDKGDPGQDAPQTAILYTSQSLSTAQKLQARQNIDAASATDMENEIDRLDERISNIGAGGGSITVDSELSTTSTNPVQNKVITGQISQAMTTLQNVVLPRLTPVVSSADNGKVLTVDGGVWVAKENTGGGSGGSIAVDSELSPTSTNPVQNKVITALFMEAQTSLEALTPDAALNAESTRPVQNKVICEQLNQANTVLGQLVASIPNDDHINALIDAYLSEALGGDY